MQVIAACLHVLQRLCQRLHRLPEQLGVLIREHGGVELTAGEGGEWTVFLSDSHPCDGSGRRYRYDTAVAHRTSAAVAAALSASRSTDESSSPSLTPDSSGFTWTEQQRKVPSQRAHPKQHHVPIEGHTLGREIMRTSAAIASALAMSGLMSAISRWASLAVSCMVDSPACRSDFRQTQRRPGGVSPEIADCRDR